MANDERFWEASIAEAIKGDNPPDVTTRVLRELAEGEQSVAQPSEVNSERKVLRSVLRLVTEVAVAAGVMFAIAWLTGLIQLGGTETADPDKTTEPMTFAASPDAVVTENENSLELKQGWLLVTTGAPPVHCEGSTLTEVDGRVLLHAGGAPSREQTESVRPWLNANNLETSMITNPKHWVSTLTLAALVLSGSASLDGERIEAQEEEKSVPAEWYIVQSVMDIQQLPDDAAFVRGENLTGAHLEFLAAHEPIRGLDLRGLNSFSEADAEMLGKFKNLSYLDLRGAEWEEGTDYSVLESASGLKTLKVDYWPAILQRREASIFEASGSDTLAKLAEGGVRISVSRFTDDEERLRALLERVPTLFELQVDRMYETVYGNGVEERRVLYSDAHMKLLAKHEALESLDIRYAYVTELGLAYLARSNRLTSLTLETELREDYLFQVGQMTSLRDLTLELRDQPASDAQEEMVLNTMVGLTHLRSLAINLDLRHSRDPAKELKPLEKLESLTFFDRDTEIRDIGEFLKMMQVPSQTSIQHFGLLIQDVDMLTESLPSVLDGKPLDLEEQPEASDKLTELRLEFDGRFHSDSRRAVMDKQASKPGFVTLLGEFENLKRIELCADHRDDVTVLLAYADKWLSDYEVDISLRE